MGEETRRKKLEIRNGKWERWRGKPNYEAEALVLLVRRYPDTLERLEKVAAGLCDGNAKSTWKSENRNWRTVKRKPPLMLRMNGASGTLVPFATYPPFYYRLVS